MKIYNISLYEKLKIRPVDINSLDDVDEDGFGKLVFVHLDPEAMKLSDLSLGDIVKTELNSYYIMVSKATANTIGVLHKDDQYVEYILLRPNSNSRNGVSYLTLKGFVKFFPLHDKHDSFNITDVWRSGADTSRFKTGYDIYDFFTKYNIENL